MRRFFFFILLAVVPFPLFSQGMKEVVNNSHLAFTIPEKDLIPENLAYNPGDRCFYAGSTHQRKVLKRFPDGHTEDFIPEARDGQWMVVGMKVDTIRHQLWFCSSVGDVMKGYRDGDFGTHTGVFRYDLKTGKLIKKYLPERPGELHFFNDLVMNRKGDLFITDMAGNALYVISSSYDSLRLFATLKDFAEPNGICISSDESNLFIATDNGIASVELKSGICTLVKHDSSVDTRGIDGLYFYRNSLVAVQNSRSRILQYHLNSTLDEIESARVLEANHPFFSMNPTTGTIIGDTFYYIANSQFGSFDEAHQIFPPEKLFEVVVLKTVLTD